MTKGTENTIIIDDFFNVRKTIMTPKYDMAFLDPDYNDYKTMRLTISFIKQNMLKPDGAIICFSYPETIPQELEPDQVIHWIKPTASRNTKKSYASFVEAISVWHGKYFNQFLNPWCRNGIFTDICVRKHNHPFRKPFSLVEKLILLHCPINGRVIDPFAGSLVTHDVCVKNGINSVCIDKIDWR